MTPLQLEQAVADWLVLAAPGRVLVKGRVGEAAAPDGPYVLYWLERYTLPDSPRVSVPAPFIDQKVEAPATPCEFGIVVVGDRAGQTARDDALRLCLSLRQTQRSADLLKVCGLMGVSEVANRSALETGTHRSRADFRLTLSAILDLSEPGEVIEQVDLGIHELTIPHTATITVEGP